MSVMLWTVETKTILTGFEVERGGFGERRGAVPAERLDLVLPLLHI